MAHRIKEHILSRWFILRFIGFSITCIILIFLFKNIIYEATIQTAMQKIEMVLQTNQAISDYISKEQKPEVRSLRDNNFLEEDYFNPKLLSGSYITKRIQHYYNVEQKKHSGDIHEFKFSSANPLNPENLATTYEKDILQKMNDGDIDEFKEVLKKDGKHYLYYAKSTKKADKSCLRCHSDPSIAPKGLIEHYGTKGGFGYKIGDILGMNSIYTPIEKELSFGNDILYYLVGITILILSSVFLLTEGMFLQLQKKREAEEKNKNLEGELEYQNIALQKTLEIISQHIMLSKTDLDGNIIEVSKALCSISGYEMEELIGHPHSIVRHPDTPKETFKQMWEFIQVGKTWQGEIKNRTKDGKSFWVDIVVAADLNDKGNIIGYSSFWHDASHKKQMELMSITDTLTELYNRRYFQQVFDNEVQRTRRAKEFFVFLMMDLDFFKRYNDTYGHLAGDEVLRSTSKTMKDTFSRGGDFCFRLGGEEFGIIYSSLTKDKALAHAEVLRENIEDMKIEHKNNKASAFVTTSIGIVIIDKDHKMDMDHIIAVADDALYRAKDSGRNCISE